MKKDRSDPNYIGPGVWNVIHVESSSARCKNTQNIFCVNVREICAKFPCLNCSEHCKAYLQDNPPEKYIGIKMLVDGKQEELGLSIWSWTFHNCVNLRLGKPFMDWETYYGIYIKNISNCSTKCSLASLVHIVEECDKKRSKKNSKMSKIPKIPDKLLIKN